MNAFRVLFGFEVFSGKSLNCATWGRYVSKYLADLGATLPYQGQAFFGCCRGSPKTLLCAP